MLTRRNVKLLLRYVLSLILCSVSHANGIAAPKFHDDDPILREPESQDATGAKFRIFDPVYNNLENFFSKPGDPAQNVRAQNINTIDEVPDSSWFTNRIGTRLMTMEEIEKGPCDLDKRLANSLTVLEIDNTGDLPALTVADASGQTWTIAFDPPAYPTMATGAGMIVSRLLWVIGYNVFKSQIIRLHIEDLAIDENAAIRMPSLQKKSIMRKDLVTLLQKVRKEEDGSIRALAKKVPRGQPLGPFCYEGMRPDDPNDVIPHEHRRELRGFRIIAAWLNIVNCDATHTYDALVSKNGTSTVMHYLSDFDSALGSGGFRPHDYWEGYEYQFEGFRSILRNLASFGFQSKPWQTIDFFESSSIGRMPGDNTRWDPIGWKPWMPHPAFLRARDDDSFWAAKKVMAISDELIGAAVRAGQLNDQKSELFLKKALIERRDSIGSAYFTRLNPIAKPAIEASGILQFKNLVATNRVVNPTEKYQVTWFLFDNSSGQSTWVGETSNSSGEMAPPVALPNDLDSIVRIDICQVVQQMPCWERPLTVFFRLTQKGWKLIGLEHSCVIANQSAR